MNQSSAVARLETLDPKLDAANVHEMANRLVEGLHKGASDRAMRARETAELASQVEERFDAYDAALVAARRAKEAAEERAREVEVEATAVVAEAERAMADAGRRHQAEMEAAAEVHRSEIERLREGLDRLKEEMGRRFLMLEEENAEVVSDLARQTEENVSLNRSMQMLIGAVEANARSLSDEDAALAAAMAGVRERAVGSDLPPGVVRLPQRASVPREPVHSRGAS